MRVVIEPDKCIAAGECVRVAAKVFSQDPDTGIVILLDENPSSELVEEVKRAARLCPAVAITIEEE